VTLRPLLLSLALLAPAAPARATAAHAPPARHAAAAVRSRVFSIQGLDGGDTGDALAASFRTLPEVAAASFDLYSAELTLVADARLTDARVQAVVAGAGAGLRAVPGPGQGRYLPPLRYPPEADVVVLTNHGAAVGPLERLRAPDRTTIFDFYADWCIACRPMDAHVRDFLRTHRGVAVRKLNLARWDSPLARELGPGLTALPHLVVFTPDGRRHEFDGDTWEQVARVMRWR